MSRPQVATRSAARPLDAFGVTVVIGLCLSFGLNQVAIKLAIPEIPPLIQAAARSAAAALIVALWMRSRGLGLIFTTGRCRPASWLACCSGSSSS